MKSQSNDHFEALFQYTPTSMVLFEFKNHVFYLIEGNDYAKQMGDISSVCRKGDTLDRCYEGEFYHYLPLHCTYALLTNKPTIFTPYEGVSIQITPIVNKETHTSYVMLESQHVKGISQSSVPTTFSILEYATDLIEMLDTDYGVLHTSPSVTENTGFYIEDVIGENWLEFAHEKDRNEVRKKLEDCLKKKKPTVVEFRRWNIQGNFCWMESTVSPIFNEKNEFHYYLIISRNIQKRRKATQKLHRLAFHDALTNLPNRRLFNQTLQRTLDESNLKQKPFALVMLDCDNFKMVNDTHGHDVGDALIKGLSKRIGKQIRKGDILARTGGDEFVLLLPSLRTEDDVRLIANRILKSVEEPWVLESKQLLTTISMGAFYYHPAKESVRLDTKMIQKGADIALYQAKKSGKNNLMFYGKDIKDE